MTKKDRILALHQEGKTTRQIAEAVYRLPKCAKQKEADRKMAYVRVVLRQRKGSGESEIDRRYVMRRWGAATPKEAYRLRESQPSRRAWVKRKYQTDPIWRAKQQKYARDRYWRMKTARESGMQA